MRAPAGGLAGLAALCAAAALAGCAPPPEESDASPGYGPEALAVSPRNGETGVPVDPIIRVSFSDHIDERTLSQGGLSFYSGPISPWIMATYDPVRRRIVVWPKSTLRANATWVLDVVEDANVPVTGLDGLPVKPGTLTSFRTGTAAGNDAPYVARAYDEDVRPIFERHCAACHEGPAAGVAGLRLDTIEGVRDTAMGVLSQGWPDWPRIAPSRPGQSYLVYKLIGYEGVVGAPMPASWEPGVAASRLTRRELEAVSDWIAGGATFFDRLPGEE
jgi:hypothetical protein